MLLGNALGQTISAAEVIAELLSRGYDLAPVTAPPVIPSLAPTRVEVLQRALNEILSNRGLQAYPIETVFLAGWLVDEIIHDIQLKATQDGAPYAYTFIRLEAQEALLARGYATRPADILPETPITYPPTTLPPDYLWPEFPGIVPLTLILPDPVVPETPMPPIPEEPGTNWLLILGAGAAGIMLLGDESRKKKRKKKRKQAQE